MSGPDFDLKTSAGSRDDAAGRPLPVRNDIKSFEELDLKSELLTQYNRAIYLYQTAENDFDTTASQKAAVLNAIRQIQEQVLRSLERLHNVQRLKLIETTLVDTLKAYPETREAFLASYKTALEAAEASLKAKEGAPT